jgi:hypothetical protein
VQAIGTDQYITFGRTAVFELDPHAALRAEHSDRPGIESDALGGKAF